MGKAELYNLVPGYSAMSPRTQCEETVKHLLFEFKKKSLKPLAVFKMADSQNQGTLPLGNLLIAFKKILP